jgi:hypothetical protein
MERCKNCGHKVAKDKDGKYTHRPCHEREKYCPCRAAELMHVMKELPAASKPEPVKKEVEKCKPKSLSSKAQTA